MPNAAAAGTLTEVVPARHRQGRLREQERAENFPVALMLLPPATRRHLRAVYDVTRVIDDLGDRAAGDRVAMLQDFRDELTRLWSGTAPRQPVLQALAPTVMALGLPEQPFQDLVEANLQDQRVTSYETFDDLVAYCHLSADPVGRLVLRLFESTSGRAVELSDQVCTALQLLEFWQDVAEDRRDGRTYLPQETLRRFAVAPGDLAAPTTSPALRRALAYETLRAESMLAAGPELLRLLHGWARLAVAGYVAGGLATVAALRREGFDVMVVTPRPSRRDTAVAALRLLATRARGRNR